MRILKAAVLILALTFTAIALADNIPVEDLSTSATPAQTAPQPAAAQPNVSQSVTAPADASYTQQNLTVDQRVAKLEQQMLNFTQMNLPQRIDDLQQKVQQLQGQLDEANHENQVLSQQLRNFYQDLNSRIGQQPAAGQAAATTDASGAEEQAYKTAFDSLTAKKYDDATKLMLKYINDYPTGKYVANAHYWLGEVYYLQNNLVSAATEMQTVVKQFPTSAKVPDAMLKMALIYNSQKKYSQAKDELNQIKKKFPNSTAAQMVDQQMQMIGKPAAQ